MARNDGVDRTVARNRDLKKSSTLESAQAHNERQKEAYSNPDIVPERTPLNIHFKEPTGSYEDMFAELVEKKVISVWGLKPESTRLCELVFDVNSAYFYNRGGYEFARQFYADAYEAAVKIVGGEQYILSAVMHADERNRAMSEALGEDVYHYHLHVVYVPVVKKDILWTKRCKDPALIGTVKETVMQVSRSKKWESKQAVDESGTPMVTANGKKILKKSYSVLQDDFYQSMLAAGYTDLQRGELGSTEEHLTVTQFKVQQERQRLAEITEKAEQEQSNLTKLERQTAAALRWTDVYADCYTVQRREKGGEIWTELGTVTGTNFVDGSLPMASTPDELYEYRVTPVIEGAEKAPSNTVEVLYNPFSDVASAGKRLTYLAWAFNNGIVKGSSKTTFSPDDGLTRAQFIMMLWKLDGSPEMTGELPFTDVTGGKTTNALLWALGRGIIVGAEEFHPDNNIKRSEVLMILWKLAGSPVVEGKHPFTDVTGRKLSKAVN